MKEIELKQKRKRVGLTQDQLAKKLGINRVTLSRYETGVMTIPRKIILAVRALERGLK